MQSVGEKRTGKNVWKNNLKNDVSSERKFREAQIKLQAAVQKYTNDYESSSSEDELESDELIGRILKNYSQFDGNSEHLGRTQSFLEESLVSGAAICLICIGSVKRAEKIWSCVSCYCVFHLQCIERWSKDSVTQQKESLNEIPNSHTIQIHWGCPKCRYDYKSDQIPREYKCFCGKTLNPALQPWLVPHSCGDICGKKLNPICGHECVLLCHPGPCPPCPKTVDVTCYCGSKPAKPQRCSSKDWSCGAPCRKLLSCLKHSCLAPCHSGNCQPCRKRSNQKCNCGAEEQMRDCATPTWQCNLVCGRPFSCGNHKCPEVCHAGSCGDCLLTKPRTCPCGKSSYKLFCTEETPTCGNTCGKLLECGAHTCNQRCHKDKCGTCLEIVIKSCRCGLHQKEIQCKKQYLCDTKCKRIRDCNKHPCNRKCCDGACPPCEKPCGRTLTCGLHKCTSVCHRGPCYPCQLTADVKCRCGSTAITVPCGRAKRTKPPRCSKPCKIPPDCHHLKRDFHRCHFGECPPCRQTCEKNYENCTHLCPNVCHSVVLIKVEGQKASMPWEQINPYLERKSLPCPDCKVPVPVTCFGGHETYDVPCHEAKSSSCQKQCGRKLKCGNHFCSLICHVVNDAMDSFTAGSNCEPCENPCSFPRPEGCQHMCPLPCHPDTCPPCKQMIRLKCHCGLNHPYVRCVEWTNPKSDKEKLMSCGNQCPKNYECGHRCRGDCHSGPCPNAEQCKKKVKVTCACKRIKKDVSCELVRNSKSVSLECDAQCKEKQEQDSKQQELELETKKREEEMRNAKELELFEKKFQNKKKYRDRKRNFEVEETSFIRKYWYILVAFISVVIAIYMLL